MSESIFAAANIKWGQAREAILETGWAQVNGLIPKRYFDDIELAYHALLVRFAPDRFGGFKAPGLLAQQAFHDAALRFKSERPQLSGAVYDSIQCAVPLVRLSSSPELVGAVAALRAVPEQAISNFNHGVLMAVPHDQRNFIGWHQDTFNDEHYDDYGAGITAWIPMHSTGIAEGSLIVAPGSHRERVARVAQNRGTGASLSYGLPQEYLDRFPKAHVSAGLGDVVFISMNIAHSAGVNSSSRIRYTVQTRYFPVIDAHFVAGKPIYKSSVLE